MLSLLDCALVVRPGLFLRL